MNERIKGTDIIGYADYLHIIFGDKRVKFFTNDERSLDFTFDEVMDVATKNGYKTEMGTILLIAESPLDGIVYRYGNYGDYWVKCGATIGYA